MVEESADRAASPWLKAALKHRTWIVLGLTLLLVLAVRVRLRGMPLERDEGEYAYAGQLMLHGVPPYRDAYNMKLPGTYAAYALIMALFGQSPSGIHFGVALVNAASVLLMFWLGRELLDEVTGLAAAVSFALLSLSPAVLGLAGHATHFVVLPALGGAVLMLHALAKERFSSAQAGRPGNVPVPPRPAGRRDLLIFASGLLFGLALLMKQHGLFFGVFGGLWLLWNVFLGNRPSDGRQRPKVKNPINVRPLFFFAAGWVLPYALTCLVLWWAGVFHAFIFWTVSYAGKYATVVPPRYGPDVLRRALDVVVGPNLALWLLPWAGALMMWWEERLTVERRFVFAAFLLCSAASVSVGFHFRNHYFITLIPALALLTGVAVSRALHLLKHDRTIELFLAIPILGAFFVGCVASVIGNGAVWFASPADAEWGVYASTLFDQAATAADYIRTHSGKAARVAVVGSEPEIYFYAHRLSATGYIYTYPLMEEQPYAAKMPDERIAEIERARPDWAVYVDDDLSWLPWRHSPPRLRDWWGSYWVANFDVVTIFKIEEPDPDSGNRAEARNRSGDPKLLMLLRRKGAEELRNDSPR